MSKKFHIIFEDDGTIVMKQNNWLLRYLSNRVDKTIHMMESPVELNDYYESVSARTFQMIEAFDSYPNAETLVNSMICFINSMSEVEIYIYQFMLLRYEDDKFKLGIRCADALPSLIDRRREHAVLKAAQRACELLPTEGGLDFSSDDNETAVRIIVD